MNGVNIRSRNKIVEFVTNNSVNIRSRNKIVEFGLIRITQIQIVHTVLRKSVTLLVSHRDKSRLKTRASKNFGFKTRRMIISTKKNDPLDCAIVQMLNRKHSCRVAIVASAEFTYRRFQSCYRADIPSF
jgi:hypothetical protein